MLGGGDGDRVVVVLERPAVRPRESPEESWLRGCHARGYCGCDARDGELGWLLLLLLMLLLLLTAEFALGTASPCNKNKSASKEETAALARHRYGEEGKEGKQSEPKWGKAKDGMRTQGEGNQKCKSETSAITP